MSLRRSTRTLSKTVSPLVQDLPVKDKKRQAEAIQEGFGKKHKNSSNKTTVPKVPLPKPAVALKKSRVTTSKASTLTSTPSLANTVRAPYSAGDIDDATPPPEDRPVEPHVTNAPLVTPRGTRNVAYSNDNPASDPSTFDLPEPTATTGTILDKACAHLIKIDSRMKPLIESHRCDVFSPEGLAEEVDPFESLSSGIVSQQVSGAAANSIKNKFVALFHEGNSTPTFPTPAQVAVTDIARLRTAGLSQRKAEYIQGLAQKFVDGSLNNEMLMNATDEQVMEKLIAVRGLGKWSVEMFSCFGLKRLDILSTGDLGVQRGMAEYFGKDVQKLKAKGGGKWKYMSEQDMLDKSAPYAPYRSLFMWYMWRISDADVKVMQPT